MISSGWRATDSTVTPEQFDEQISIYSRRTPEDEFVSKHGRYQIRLFQDGGKWVVEYTSTGRLFGPREVIYSGRHSELRHAAWDVMCRVIRATDNEQTGIEVGRLAMGWLQNRQAIC